MPKLSRQQTQPVNPTSPATTPEIVGLLTRYLKDGPNAEYLAFERRVSGVSAPGVRRGNNVWDFINDAVTGGGGFSDGTYLFPFAGEIENAKLSVKLQRQRVEADYDRFAEHVCNAPWDLIVSGSDMIERKADGEAKELLADFWTNVNNRGTSMMDFLENPFRQARQYRTGWIVMDRPSAPLNNKRDDLAPENRPYIYSVPSRNVVDWQFDDDGNLVAIVILEPKSGHKSGDPCPIRIWTTNAWAVFEPIPNTGKKKNPDNYYLASSGPNDLGRVPVVPAWNDQPEDGNALGDSEMLDVARLAQTVYNIDSEVREIERKCALFLAIPVKSTSDYSGGQVVVGLDNAVVYDGDSGEPSWVSPDLTILERLSERREEKIDSSYKMAHLRALNGAAATIQTKSGFHAEVEFQKTERRIARHAAMLENVEKQLAILFLKFYGIDATKQPDLFSVTYPRDFGVRDLQKLKEDVKDMLDMNLGELSDRAEITKLLKARHPRLQNEEIAKMVDGAIAARSNAAKQKSAIDRIKAMAAQARQQQPPAGDSEASVQ